MTSGSISEGIAFTAYYKGVDNRLRIVISDLFHRALDGNGFLFVQ